ncbi:MAG: hypothetical protein AB7V62_11970 [Thermoleophilia bacterium]
MTAWVILIGFAIAVVGVVVKVGHDIWTDLRADRDAHGGRQTVAAARRALIIALVVIALVVVLVIWPLVLGDEGN